MFGVLPLVPLVSTIGFHLLMGHRTLPVYYNSKLIHEFPSTLSLQYKVIFRGILTREPCTNAHKYVIHLNEAKL